MNRACRAALHLYQIDDSELKLIKSSSNLIYESKNRILQFTPTSYKTKQELLKEVSWIEYLNKNDFEVVQVIRSVNNNLLEQVEGFTIICYEKIIGKQVTRSDWNASFFERLGTFTGKLHRLGKAFEKENKRGFKNWNDISKGRFAAYLPEDHRALKKLYAALISKFKTYAVHEDHFGLIHYDIHHENYLLKEGNNKIILFDFEMSCRSWYINDIAVILYYILNTIPVIDRKEVSELFLSAFFQTYRKERSMAEEEKEKIPLFLLYRDLLVYGYTFRTWTEAKKLTKNQYHFRKKLRDSITRRRIALGL
jgi:Ser/Thr protein kinase RdoA (MazF antagonist)